MKRFLSLLLILTLTLACAALAEANNNTLTYASGDYTRINPAMDEHASI